LTLSLASIDSYCCHTGLLLYAGAWWSGDTDNSTNWQETSSFLQQ